MNTILSIGIVASVGMMLIASGCSRPRDGSEMLYLYLKCQQEGRC